MGLLPDVREKVEVAGIDVDRVLERECENCKSCKPGRKSECEIRKTLLYGQTCAQAFRTWAEGQVFGGYCKQRRPK